MSNVLFLNIPAHGHVNPTLGLAEGLVRKGERVIYFCSDEFKEKIEGTGAEYKSFGENAGLLVRKFNSSAPSILEDLDFEIRVLEIAESMIKGVLEQLNGIKIDYIVQGYAFPFGKIISMILDVPTISSFEVFAKKNELQTIDFSTFNKEELKKLRNVMDQFRVVATMLKNDYHLEMLHLIDMLENVSELNIAYSSLYFVPHPEYYDDSYLFIGPPIFERKENLDDFPFEEIKDKKVVYISLGTIFNQINYELYNVFFQTFEKEDVVVVMSAYHMDISKFEIPQNFIVRNFVPQSEILKFTSVAITHGGMNSTNDLLYNNIPFVTIPFGADQPYMAKRVEELGAGITLDYKTITAEILKDAIYKVETNETYRTNMKKISDSFKETGGYEKAIEEILKFIRKKC